MITFISDGWNWEEALAIIFGDFPNSLNCIGVCGSIVFDFIDCMGDFGFKSSKLNGSNDFIREILWFMDLGDFKSM